MADYAPWLAPSTLNWLGRGMMEKTKVAVVGMGTVGCGVARLLLDHGDRTARHAGRTLWLERVVVRDVGKRRDVELPSGVLTNKLSQITDDPDIQVVAQLIGGIEPARTIMLQLLESGKDIVTANKALLAEHGPELFDRARELGRSIAFEASVAGGIPIITNIGQCLSANQVQSLRGILNGTSNYIMTQMSETGADYAHCIREAQARGYAEADPTMDVNGTDAAQKLAILAHLAYGVRVRWRDIPRLGVDRLDEVEFQNANRLGYRIKLVASAHLNDDGVELHVGPTFVRAGLPLAEVRGAYNAVQVRGDAVGRVFFHGLGAGQMPTASAVVADMIDSAVGRTRITFRNLELWSNRDFGVDVSDPRRVLSRFYLRFTIEDRPGVLASIAGELGKQGISIASVVQHEPACEGRAHLVVMTHQARQGAISDALGVIDQLKEVLEESVQLRVLDE